MSNHANINPSRGLISIREPIRHPEPTLPQRWALIKAAAQGKPIMHRMTIDFGDGTVLTSGTAVMINCRVIGRTEPAPRRSGWWHLWWGFTHPFGPRSGR